MPRYRSVDTVRPLTAANRKTRFEIDSSNIVGVLAGALGVLAALGKMMYRWCWAHVLTE
jgi:hypothetical protein